MLRVLDLFSGIGAYALGVERAGMKVVAFCECEDFPRRVLRKHWPDVPIYEDVRTLTADTLRRDGIAVDVIVGGWPCQDISPAGTRSGLDGERSGLWSEVRRILGELPHAVAIMENSSNLLGLDGGIWFSRILGDLAALGRDAEWHCLPAAAFDAPHIRDRLWIVAHASNDRHGKSLQPIGQRRREETADARRDGASQSLADSPLAGRAGRRPSRPRREARHIIEGSGCTRDRGSVGPHLAHAYELAPIGSAIARTERHTWAIEPDVGRVAAGVADRVDRIHGLGNCNPPIIPETIARAVIAAHTNGLKPALASGDANEGGK